MSTVCLVTVLKSHYHVDVDFVVGRFPAFPDTDVFPREAWIHSDVSYIGNIASHILAKKGFFLSAVMQTSI